MEKSDLDGTETAEKRGPVCTAAPMIVMCTSPMKVPPCGQLFTWSLKQALNQKQQGRAKASALQQLCHAGS